MSEETPAGPVCWCGEDWTQAHADAMAHQHDEDMECCAGGPSPVLMEHFPLPPRTYGRAKRIHLALTEAGVPAEVMDAAVTVAWGFSREAWRIAWDRSRDSAKQLDAEQIASLTAEAEKLDARWRHWKAKTQEMERDRDRYAEFVWAVRPAFEGWLAGDPTPDLMTILRRSFEELDAKAPKPPTPSYEAEQP